MTITLEIRGKNYSDTFLITTWKCIISLYIFWKYRETINMIYERKNHREWYFINPNCENKLLQFDIYRNKIWKKWSNYDATCTRTIFISNTFYPRPNDSHHLQLYTIKKFIFEKWLSSWKKVQVSKNMLITFNYNVEKINSVATW